MFPAAPRIYPIAAALILTGIPFSNVYAQQVVATAPVSLSMTEAIRRTQTVSPQARAALARLRAADARQRGARTQPTPTITLAGDTGGLGDDLFVSQPLEIGDKVSARVASARGMRRAADAEIRLTSADLALTARTAYIEALRTRTEQELAADQLANARSFADAAALQYQAGDVPRSNVVRSKIEVTRAEQALRIAETERENRYATLRSLTGLPGDAPLTLTDSLIFADTSFNLPDLQAAALQSRPDLVAAREQLAARGADIRGAKAQRQPDLLVEARRVRWGNASSGQALRFGVTFPLGDTGRIAADVRAADAAREEQVALLAELERTVRLDVEIAYRTAVQTKATAESFRAGRLDQSKELLSMVQVGYERGANSYIELLDAQQVYRTEQVEYARALAAYQIAIATLERAVGGKLP